MGKGLKAEKMSVQAMKVRKIILGREYYDTLDSIAIVGLAYKLRGCRRAGRASDGDSQEETLLLKFLP